jgi:hypothetical protein
VRRISPEFVAVPMVLVGMGILFAIFWAAHAGVGAWIVVGLLLAAGIVGLGVVVFRGPLGHGGHAVSKYDGGAGPVSDGVHRVLVVVETDCAPGDLERIAGPGTPTAALVVAPAVSSRIARLTGDEQAYGDADAHLRSALSALAELGVDADGHVGSHDPLQATDEALRAFPADEIVFVLGGSGEGASAERDVAETARRRYEIPVSVS